jgi:hypothetical protein
MNVATINSFQNDIVNSKIRSGKKLRFDIGTSISAPVTRYWFNMMNDIYVIGIEPNPDCYDKPNLWNNRSWNILDEFRNHPQGENYYHIIGACDNVDHVVEKPFYLLNGNVGCSSLLEPNLDNITGCMLDKMINVETFPMSMLLDKLDYDLIELIKIDTQGKDLDIVKSFNKHIKNVCYLDVEDDSTRQYHSAPSRAEMMAYITELNFEYYQYLNGNLRFINKSIDIPKNYNNITGDM